MVLLSLAIVVFPALALSSLTGGAGGLTVITVYVLWVAYASFQRVWILRILRRQSCTWAELWRSTRPLLGRFLGLGLLSAVPVATIFGVLSAVAGAYHVSNGHVTTNPNATPGYAVTIVVAATAIEAMALTFAIPALAFSTRRISVALRYGLGVARRAWPASIWYILTPALTIVIYAAGTNHVGERWAITLFFITAACLLLWLRGATVLLYSRLFPDLMREA
jgi:hypothetical protein